MATTQNPEKPPAGGSEAMDTVTCMTAVWREVGWHERLCIRYAVSLYIQKLASPVEVLTAGTTDLVARMGFKGPIELHDFRGLPTAERAPWRSFDHSAGSSQGWHRSPALLPGQAPWWPCPQVKGSCMHNTTTYNCLGPAFSNVTGCL